MVMKKKNTVAIADGKIWVENERERMCFGEGKLGRLGRSRGREYRAMVISGNLSQSHEIAELRVAQVMTRVKMKYGSVEGGLGSRHRSSIRRFSRATPASYKMHI